MTINPDNSKQEMATRGLIPDLDGLSPMEASVVVHAESAYLAKRLARRAMDDGKNIIWDITMNSLPTTEERLDDPRPGRVLHQGDLRGRRHRRGSAAGRWQAPPRARGLPRGHRVRRQIRPARSDRGAGRPRMGQPEPSHVRAGQAEIHRLGGL